MEASLNSNAARLVPCKCCGAMSPILGAVDFNKNCMQSTRPELAPCGVNILYHRCPRCGFVFTTAFDHFTAEDFKRHIYNERYVLVDPDYESIRPQQTARQWAAFLPQAKPLRVLDYGGGNGRTAAELRAHGYEHVETYDPMVARYAQRPQGPFDCVLCVEVIEHSTDPARTFREMNELLAPDGLILFTTLVLPADFEQIGLSWWYIAPRNGHVSIFTRAALDALAAPLGLRYGTFNDSLHVLLRTIPPFARHLFASA